MKRSIQRSSNFQLLTSIRIQDHHSDFLSFSSPPVAHRRSHRIASVHVNPAAKCSPFFWASLFLYQGLAFTKPVQFSTRTVYLIQSEIVHAHITRTCFKPLSTFFQWILFDWVANMANSVLPATCWMKCLYVISWNSLISGHNQVGLFIFY